MMKSLASSYVSKAISLSYLPNPLSEVIQRMERKGGQVWQLFEPVDGFHPNQVHMNFLSDE